MELGKEATDLTIKLELYGWQFRIQRSGDLESRNISKGIDWAIRSWKTIGILEDQLWLIQKTLRELNSIFPKEQEALHSHEEEVKTYKPITSPA